MNRVSCLELFSEMLITEIPFSQDFLFVVEDRIFIIQHKVLQ